MSEGPSGLVGALVIAAVIGWDTPARIRHLNIHPRRAVSGLEVCVTVTLLDGLVLARSAFHHSVNYRSVVVHGTASVVEDLQEKTTALAALVEAVAPGRTGGTRSPSRNELAATMVLRLDLREVSVKVRTGPPNDDPEDLGLRYWAGVLPLVTRPGTPQPNDDLPDGVAVPDHVTAWRRPRTL